MSAPFGLDLGLLSLAGWPDHVGPAACPDKLGPLEARAWAWALSCQCWRPRMEALSYSSSGYLTLGLARA
ncbi:hypothetical protein L3X38_018029 [Prunus dulcis]|uniref:Uncharacterized protein n=1 Tax=Prunus dulcis TaxID=3755 RepID=A0AAD4WA84_PRUDU|nr:hypothetical protein L3X38_018029 [Prunus dulcis]